MVHGFQLLDIWVNHSAGNSCSSRMFKFIDTSAAGTAWSLVHASVAGTLGHLEAILASNGAVFLNFSGRWASADIVGLLWLVNK